MDRVDGFHKGLLSKGLKPLTEPQDSPWGNREFVIRDPDGYRLVIFEYIFMMIRDMGHVYPNGGNNRAKVDAADLFWESFMAQRLNEALRPNPGLPPLRSGGAAEARRWRANQNQREPMEPTSMPKLASL